MNGIEKDLKGKADVIRINLNSQLGKDIAERFDVTSAKTTVVLNGKGQEVYRRVGRPERAKIVELTSH